MGLSVLPAWMSELRLQQQSVLILALRGPDGDPKHTPFKHLLRAYRGTVLVAAKYGRLLSLGEKADSFMSLDEFYIWDTWTNRVDTFLEDAADGSVLHHYTHFMHGAEILGYKHPDAAFRERWWYCYESMALRLHLNPETEEQMDRRLRDWDNLHWSGIQLNSRGSACTLVTEQPG